MMTRFVGLGQVKKGQCDEDNHDDGGRNENCPNFVPGYWPCEFGSPREQQPRHKKQNGRADHIGVYSETGEGS